RFVAHRVSSRVRRDSAVQLDVEGFAEAVARQAPHFLMAQLVVHEALEDPASRPKREWDGLLTLDHQRIFSRALKRLHKKHPTYRAVLVALAFSKGLGIPMHDGVWRSIAQAIDNLESRRRSTITDEDIEKFLD